MTNDFSLHVHKPVRIRGQWRAFAQARINGVTVATDRLKLDDPAEREKFAEKVRSKLGDRAPSPESIEAQLLKYLPDLDGFNDDVDGEVAGAAKASQADRLVEITASIELFHDKAGDTYARLDVDGHSETWSTRDKGLRRWLIREAYVRTGKVPNSQAFADALTVIEAQAQFDGSCRHVSVRVAPDGAGGLFLDLADDGWRAVHITPLGWHVVHNPPVYFRRPAGMLPLPLPESGGHLDELRQFINSGSDIDWILIKAWMIAAVRDRGPYPLLVLHGEQGTAKSTVARMVISLIDPSSPDLRSDPREVRDLAIATRNNWIVAFDNVSHLAPWLSDALCRLATGGGWATRQLYSDVDEVLFEAQRPVILTGISEFITRGDLFDRTLQVVLPTIAEEARMPEEVLWAAFELARPRLLGALLDAVVGALRELPQIHLERSPRLADFARWAVAAERGMAIEVDGADGADGADGLAGGLIKSEGNSPFLNAYRGARADSWEQAIDASPIGAALRTLVVQELATGLWEGTAAQLLERLNEISDEQTKRARHWPKSPRALSGELRRLAPALRGVGFSVELDIRIGHERRRLIRLAKPPSSGGDSARSSASSASSAEIDGYRESESRAYACVGSGAGLALGSYAKTPSGAETSDDCELSFTTLAANQDDREDRPLTDGTNEEGASDAPQHQEAIGAVSTGNGARRQSCLPGLPALPGPCEEERTDVTEHEEIVEWRA